MNIYKHIWKGVTSEKRKIADDISFNLKDKHMHFSVGKGRVIIISIILVAVIWIKLILVLRI